LFEPPLVSFFFQRAVLPKSTVTAGLVSGEEVFSLTSTRCPLLGPYAPSAVSPVVEMFEGPFVQSPSPVSGRDLFPPSPVRNDIPIFPLFSCPLGFSIPLRRPKKACSVVRLLFLSFSGEPILFAWFFFRRTPSEVPSSKQSTPPRGRQLVILGIVSFSQTLRLSAPPQKCGFFNPWSAY